MKFLGTKTLLSGLISVFNFILQALNFGMFLLIWLVQIIIYPSFYHLDKNEFKIWHQRYSSRISSFVIPMMFGQLGLGIYLLINEFSILHLVAISSVLIAWAITFLQSVPCHRCLTKNGKDVQIIDRLLKGNLIRAIAWTFAFILDLSTVFI